MSEQCRYMAAAYPGSTADETCHSHRHEARTFDLARAFAAGVHETPDPTDEQVGWFLDDADAVVDDFDPVPESWVTTAFEYTGEAGLDLTLTINGRPYVVQDNMGSGEACTPVARSTWESWTREDEPCPHKCSCTSDQECPHDCPCT